LTELNQQKRTLRKKASYRKIKVMGGFCMARKYTHIKALEPKIRQLKEEGKTNREIAEHFGFKDKEASLKMQ